MKKGQSANLNPILQDFWSSRTIAGIAHFKSKSFILVAHYSQPTETKDSDAELEFLVNNIRHAHRNMDIIIAGDFNRPQE